MSINQNVACIADVIRKAPYQYDAIRIYYNHFVNSISQKTKVIELMNKQVFFANFNRFSIHEVDEPESEFSRHYFYELYVASRIIRQLIPCHAAKCGLRTNFENECHGKCLQKRRRNFKGPQFIV